MYNFDFSYMRDTTFLMASHGHKVQDWAKLHYTYIPYYIHKCKPGSDLKVYLYPKNMFLICEKGHSLEVHCTNIQWKNFIK